MKWRIYSSKKKPRMALFISKYDHCLYDLLGRYNSGELNLEIPFIISNHLDLKPIADSFKIPFYYFFVLENQLVFAILTCDFSLSAFILQMQY